MNGKWIEIFKGGEQTDSKGRTRAWSEADLDHLVNSYNPADYEAPIVIGHPTATAPAYGWVEQLKRAGLTVLAKFKQVPAEFEQLVKGGHYKKRSIRILPDGKLGHVGFLGAAAPAIAGLKDIEFSADNDSSEYDFNTQEEEFMDARLKELQAELDAEKAKNVKLEQEKNDFQKRAEKGEADFSASQKAAQRKDISDFVEQGIRDGKILPAWKEGGMVDFMCDLAEQGGEFEFSAGDGTKKQSRLDWFRKFISDFSAHPLFKEMVKPGEETDKKDADFAADEKLAEEMASYVTPQK
jgi:hypothetical protein